MADRKAFLLRINPRLWDALEAWAGDEMRSVNGQIEYLLARAVRDAGRERRERPAPPDKPRGSSRSDRPEEAP
jgi:hypothetical protein